MAGHRIIRRSILQLVCAAFVMLCSSTCSSSLQFAYPSFDAASKADFSFTPDSSISNGSLQITPNAGNMTHRSGRVMYARETLKLWNRQRTALTSFQTEFVLNILPQKGGAGEGMAFILTNHPALPRDSSGQWLGVSNNRTDGAASNRIVALEFDTRRSFEADVDGNHIGIDYNGVRSIAQYPLNNLSIVLSSGTDLRVTVVYDGAVLSLVAVMDQMVFSGAWTVDLSRYLLDDISLGFAASTGEFAELNQVRSWNFSTSGDEIAGDKGRLVLFLAVFIPLVVALLIMALLLWRRLTRRTRLAYRNLEKMIDAHGPVRFKLRELRNATANFSDGRKLGRGGSGTVYLGYLRRMGMEVAVKRVSTNVNSNRGEKEFVAEVNTISNLSHRNLVKLIGWCHKKGELLLVSEYFPMGSLDKLLYARERTASSSTSLMSASTETPVLTWERRYKIIRGVASALDYLHHGSSKRILHRDVKASNVMLDEEYNARLGDFGLARVIQHDGVTHHSTQAVAGTRGYMAYESFFTGRASLDTDVYAFGVFVMEVVSGRSPSNAVLYHEDDDKEYSSGGKGWQGVPPMHIADWAWMLYGEGKTLHAADPLLGGEFEQAQVDCAVRLALACCHPNPRERPSMRVAVQVLIDGAAAPEPPLHKPAFVWPPGGNRQEMELPDVGLLFTGGAGQHSSYCSMSCSISGR
ncbi:probable L-type lectin-domain containing receptor kinase S.5 [Lolium perenne]|uniref:probable L-type lectin-domain containing receptor kinase S.5 n=1 Tax=Lolium perenne TaxID=4522 RepID=UPI0021EB0BD3|nr:probable L-type lectin-domain containing receptor kinase S.5 [Lolium perenne]